MSLSAGELGDFSRELANLFVESTGLINGEVRVLGGEVAGVSLKLYGGANPITLSPPAPNGIYASAPLPSGLYRLVASKAE